MKESGEDRLKYAVYESTRAPLARSFPVSSFRAKARNLFCLRLSRRCGDSGIPDTKPSPRGEGAPKGRIGQERYERERRRSSQVDDMRKHPIHRCAVPLPRWGRLRGGGSAAFIRRSSQVEDIRQYPIHRWRGPPSPMGKAAIRECRYPML